MLEQWCSNTRSEQGKLQYGMHTLHFIIKNMVHIDTKYGSMLELLLELLLVLLLLLLLYVSKILIPYIQGGAKRLPLDLRNKYIRQLQKQQPKPQPKSKVGQKRKK